MNEMHKTKDIKEFNRNQADVLVDTYEILRLQPQRHRESS